MSPFRSYIRRTVPPAGRFLSTEDAALHLRADVESEADLVDNLIRAAVEVLEIDTRRALQTQTFELILDRFPLYGEYFRDDIIGSDDGSGWLAQRAIEIRRCPVQSVSSVKYIATDGTETTLPASDYGVDIKTEPARIYPAYGLAWPIPRLIQNAVTVTFVAGYDPGDIPQRAKQAVLMLAAHWYRNREAVGMVGDEVALAYQRCVYSLRWN